MEKKTTSEPTIHDSGYRRVNGYQVVRDDKMKDFGSTDDRKRIVRINVKKSKAYGREHDDKLTRGGAVANTIQHEVNHTADNRASEKKVYAQTDRQMRHMSSAHKKKLYNLLK